MAVNEDLYRTLRGQGVPHLAALAQADLGAPVVDPGGMTAPVTMGAAYTQAEVQALRADVAALRSVVLALDASLRTTNTIL